MYLGMAFLYIALALAFGVIWALIALPFVIAAVDQLVIAFRRATSSGNSAIPTRSGLSRKRLMGFEPTTFCMASRARGDADDPDTPANRGFTTPEQPRAIPVFHREITGVWGLKAD
jgi:hypothetical protein